MFKNSAPYIRCPENWRASLTTSGYRRIGPEVSWAPFVKCSGTEEWKTRLFNQRLLLREVRIFPARSWVIGVWKHLDHVYVHPRLRSWTTIIYKEYGHETVVITSWLQSIMMALMSSEKNWRSLKLRCPRHWLTWYGGSTSTKSTGLAIYCKCAKLCLYTIKRKIDILHRTQGA